MRTLNKELIEQEFSKKNLFERLWIERTIIGKNPFYVQIEFKDGRVIKYNIQAKEGMEEGFSINQINIYPRRNWKPEEEYLFKRIMKKNEDIARRIKSNFIAIKSVEDGLLQNWLEEKGYEIKKGENDYIGFKKLK